MLNWIRLAGIYGLSAVIIIIGYFVYLQDNSSGGFMLFVGVAIAIGIIVSETIHRERELDARIHGWIH